jgi:hypothetical protein
MKRTFGHNHPILFVARQEPPIDSPGAAGQVDKRFPASNIHVDPGEKEFDRSWNQSGLKTPLSRQPASDLQTINE